MRAFRIVLGCAVAAAVLFSGHAEAKKKTTKKTAAQNTCAHVECRDAPTLIDTIMAPVRQMKKPHNGS